MTTSHTPGPWEAVGNLVRSPMHQPEGLPRGVQIVECMDGYSQPFTEEAKANARLISAAPELLAALQAVLHDCEDLDMVPSNEPGREKSAFDLAIEAISKATGETQ